MTPTQPRLPADFVPLTIVIPGMDQPDLMGYAGNARFVGFYWDAKVGGAVWDDGRAGNLGRGENFTFTRFVRPLAFLYNVNFGSRGGKATHILIWDRQKASAYLVPRESATRFLQAQTMTGPILPLPAFAGPIEQNGSTAV